MKGLWNSESIIHVTLCFIFFFIYYFKDVLAAPTTRHLLSRPEQRDALLAFKNEFHIGKPNRYCPNDSHRKMESWGNNSDCCSWKGIKCNAKSGEVVELDLSCSFLHGRFHSNSSLQNLHFLTTLDLSFNDLTGQIPDSIGNHSHLINLILSGNHFSGRIPSSIGNLFHLTFLDLFYNQLSGQIPSSIGNLSQLTELCLFKNNLVGEIPSFYGNLNQLTSLFVGGNMLSGNFPNVLLNLTFLLELDISNNQFSGALPPNITEFPEVPRTQHEMRLLDISNNKLEGQVPSWLWTLPKLVYVNLSNNTFNGFERSKKKQGLSSVRKPSILYLLGSNNNFTGKIPSFICAMRSLSALDLSSNNFSCSIPHCLGNLKSNLSVLNLRQNNLSGSLPKDIFESLRSLDVGHNQLVGKLPRSLNRFSTLEVLNMESNRINDTFPFWLGSLQKLQVLVLRSNAFHGPIHQASFPRLRIIDISHNHFDGTLSSEYFVKWSAMSSLGTDEDQPSQKYMKDESRCYYNSMVLINKGVDLELVHILQIYTAIDFSRNKFEGEIPKSIGLLKELRVLNLSNNAFTGHMPSSMGNLKALELLDVSQNKLSGEIPQELGNLFKNQHEMTLLDISNNKLKGQVPSWLWTLPKLVYMNLSNNTFNGFERSKKKQGLSSVRKPSMVHLLGSNNNFTGKIPSFICTLRSLSVLDLSRNKFNGSIPHCLGNLNSTLLDLNLRKNNLSGGLPKDIFERLRSLDVGHNQLVGKLPRSLNRFSTLEVLDVESNRINDTFPFWIGSLQKLQVLVLRSNAFHGPIHQASFPQLRIIDISHNHFDGTLPSEYFAKWSAMLSLGKNEVGSDEMYMGDGYYQYSLVLMNKGVELELVRILKILTAIDFSGNKFEGEIPKSIGLLKELRVLNLENNAFTGCMPSSMGNLKALESLDVSQNKLSGEIPQELGELSFLAYMNFSHNKLTGLVPGGTQFRTQACSSFEGNLRLFGPSFDEVCRDIHTLPSHQQYETPESEEEDKEEVISWIAASIGFIPGIVFGLKIGYILLSYKPKWFMNPFGRNNRRRRSTTTH